MRTGAIVPAVIFGALLRLVVVAVVAGFVQLLLAGVGAPTGLFVVVNAIALLWAIVWIVQGTAGGLAEVAEQEARQASDWPRRQELWRAQQRPERQKETTMATTPEGNKRRFRRRATAGPPTPKTAAASESANTDVLAMALAHNAISTQVPAILSRAIEQAAASANLKPSPARARSVLLGARALAEPTNVGVSPVPSVAVGLAEELASVLADLLSTDAGLAAVKKAYADAMADLEGRSDSGEGTPSIKAPNAELEALARKIAHGGTVLDVLASLQTALFAENHLRKRQERRRRSRPGGGNGEGPHADSWVLRVAAPGRAMRHEEFVTGESRPHLTIPGVETVTPAGKNSSWSIRWAPDDEENRKKAKRLIQRIRGSAHKLDQALKDSLLPDVEAEHFYLHNTYSKVLNVYSHFRRRVDAITTLSESPSDSVEGDDWIAQFGRNLKERFDSRHQLAIEGYAMVGFYYSSLEALFDVIFALSAERPVPFAEFADRTWGEKFKALFGISDPAVKKHYDELLELKRSLRDPILHGLGRDLRFLVSVPGLGLVPVSYEHLTRSIHYTPTILDDAWIRRAISAFDAFDTWLRETEPHLYALMFAESSLPVPLVKQLRAAEIRTRMTSA